VARKKKDDETETKTEAPAPKQKVTALPSVNILTNLLKQARKTKQDTIDASTELSSMVRSAAEKHHLHVRAFNVIKAADRLEPEKLADFLEHLDDYLEKSGLRKRAGQVMRMPIDDDDGPRASNVKPFPAPQADAAE